MSSAAASKSISPISSQWYGSASGGASAVALGRNGGERVELEKEACWEGGGVKGVRVFSSFSMDSSDGGESQGGGTMLARRCRLRRRASQRGIEAR